MKLKLKNGHTIQVDIQTREYSEENYLWHQRKMATGITKRMLISHLEEILEFMGYELEHFDRVEE
ncbi:MAG: hypothetical protein KBD78_17000 [Oligoflexales bacterium]|nr:hypothetical protein [Oligoflexales bacterium]